MNETQPMQSKLEAENPHLFSIVSKMIKDMKFVGVFSIIYGILSCLTVVGALFGIPSIFIGIRLRDAALEYERYLITNDINAVFSGFERQQRAFFIQKVMIIATIVFFVLYIATLIMLISSGEFMDLLYDY